MTNPKPRRVTARELIATITGQDIAAVTAYQPGQHRPALWQDGEDVFAVSASPPDPTGWALYRTQPPPRAGDTPTAMPPKVWVRR